MINLNKNKINYRKEEFGGLIINIETGKTYKLNKTAYKIFLGLYNGVKLEKLIKDIVKEFGTSKKKIQHDVKQFINALIKGGFISKN